MDQNFGNNVSNPNRTTPPSPQFQRPPMAETVAKPPVYQPVKSRRVGPIVVTLVVILLVIIAALYLFASQLNTNPEPISPQMLQNENNVSNEPTTSDVPQITNTSDDPAALQNDLDTAVSGLDEQNF